MTKVPTYRVAFWHRAGDLRVHVVEAASKPKAVEAVRAMYPAVVWSSLSSVRKSA